MYETMIKSTSFHQQNIPSFANTNTIFNINAHFYQLWSKTKAGRPGGPDFYVSTVDNTRNHGPGGQGSYAIKSEADPCFAKVVEGFDTVDRMQKMSVEPGGYKRMKHYVAIKSVTILDQVW